MRKYRCTRCGAKFDVREKRFRCDCGGPMELETDRGFMKEKIRVSDYTIWRYRHLLPIESDTAIVSMGEGWTPLVQLSYRDLNLLLKPEYLSPTGSFKDRGASVLISFLREIGVDGFVEDSSGNAGAAAAAYAARAGIRCEIFAPDYASGGKLEQIRAYGARLHRIPGTRQDTARAVMAAAETNYYASHNWNPFFMEGMKTIAYEIAEQMGWNVPDVVVLPVGYGGLFLGLARGFREMQEAGAIRRLPRLLGVQAENCAPLYQAYQRHLPEPVKYVQKAPTLAEGIAAANPMRGKDILRVLREFNGSLTVVSETEIRQGMRLLARSGFFVEPTSAVVLPALDHFLEAGEIRKRDNIVMLLTGHGLKALRETADILNA